MDEEQYFFTTDLRTVAFLMMRGLYPKNVNVLVGDRVQWSFDNKDRAKKLAFEFLDTEFVTFFELCNKVRQDMYKALDYRKEE